MKEYIIKDSYRDDIFGEVLLLHIQSFEVEILNYRPDTKGLKMVDKIKKILWRELEIPILPLKDALEFYKIIRRDDKVKLIEDYLKKRASWT